MTSPSRYSGVCLLGARVVPGLFAQTHQHPEWVGRPYLAGLQEALREFTGTVVAVTHDRWFARSFDRYLLFEVGKPVNVRDDVASSA